MVLGHSSWLIGDAQSLAYGQGVWFVVWVTALAYDGGLVPEPSGPSPTGMAGVPGVWLGHQAQAYNCGLVLSLAVPGLCPRGHGR